MQLLNRRGASLQRPAALQQRPSRRVAFTPRATATVPSSTAVETPGAASAAPKKKTGPFKVALLFDCDGVIVDTEQLHRRAYCAAFEAFDLKIDGVPVVWDVPYYDILQNTVGGGKPKMKHHFNKFGWPSSIWGDAPESEDARSKLVDALQDKKTEFYKKIVEEAAEARPGVLALMDDGLSRPDVAMAICSAATKEGFVKVVNAVVGPERLAKFDLVLAGDDVSNKKPHPEIYNTAAQRLGVPPERCLVVEDSLVGLRAAAAAGMECIITPTQSSDKVDFCAEGAGAVLMEGLANPTYQVAIDDLFDLQHPQGLVKLKVTADECQVWSANPYGL